MYRMERETIEHGCVIRIRQDETALNPREEFDHVTTIVDWHRRYNIGDRKITAEEREAFNKGDWDGLKSYLGALKVVPIGMLDHGGVMIWAGGGTHWSDPQGWDSGTVGFACVIADDLIPMGIAEERAEEVINCEITELNQFISGDVWWFEIVRESDGCTLDSCGGIYGFDAAVAMARETLEHLVKVGKV